MCGFARHIITHASLTERDLVKLGSAVGGVPLIRIGELIGLPGSKFGLLIGGSSPLALNSSINCRANGDNGGVRSVPDFGGVDAHRHLSFKSTLDRVASISLNSGSFLIICHLPVQINKYTPSSIARASVSRGASKTKNQSPIQGCRVVSIDRSRRVWDRDPRRKMHNFAPKPYRSTPRMSASFSTSVHARYPFRLFFLFCIRTHPSRARQSVSRRRGIHFTVQNFRGKLGEFCTRLGNARIIHSCSYRGRTNVLGLDTVAMLTNASRPLSIRSFAAFFAIVRRVCSQSINACVHAQHNL